MTNKAFDLTKPVQTRSGKPARIVCTDVKGGLPIGYLLLHNNADAEYFYRVRGDGRRNDFSESDFDLVNVPVKTSRFTVVYRHFYGMNQANLQDALGKGRRNGSRVSPFEGVLEKIYEDDILQDVIFHRVDEEGELIEKAL